MLIVCMVADTLPGTARYRTNGKSITHVCVNIVGTRSQRTAWCLQC